MNITRMKRLNILEYSFGTIRNSELTLPPPALYLNNGLPFRLLLICC